MKGKIFIQLSQGDVMTVEQIMIDQDKELALKFIRDKIEPAIKNSEEDHCKPWE